MEIKTILFIIVLIVILYAIIRYFTTDSATLTSLVSGSTLQTISASTLGTTSTGAASSNFSYSIWFYVNDWNYRYGEPKVIFGRMASSSANSGGDVDGVAGSGPCPLVVLGPVSNNLDINMSVFPGIDANADVTTHRCAVPNVPIQRWVNLLISVYGRTLDVYMDGKLVKTCVLAGVAKVNNSADVYVTPKGGFSGWTSKLQFFPNPTDPQTAWNIYKAGYGGSMFSNLFSKYQVKVSVIENGSESNSLTI